MSDAPVSDPPAPVLPVRGATPPRSLYLHFPFCEHRCHYCDFSVHRSSDPPVGEWLDAVDAEAGQWFERAGWTAPLPLETIFVGGGTPSLMGPRMADVRRVLERRFEIREGDAEWTAESNPASLSRDLAAAWREAGVTRLSVGVQSFDDGVLRWLGRLHDSDGARGALAAARDAGFRDLNADLIFGLPADVERDWPAEVALVVESGVTHVSAYGLTAEPRTPLGRRVGAGEVRMPASERYAAEYREAVRALEAAGFEHYEVSNFCLPGHECRHNWHYWDGSSYLGLGPSAHGYLGGVRVWNVFRWEAYRRALAGDRSPLEGHEALGAGEGRLERLWLALRTKQGLAPADPLFGAVRERAADLLDAWDAEGWLSDRDGVRLTAEGWLRMDELVTALDARLATSRR